MNTENQKIFLRNMENSRTSLDKALLILSTVSIGFSVYLLNTVDGVYPIYKTILLLVGLWSFCITIISTFCSHACSEECNTLAYDYDNMPDSITHETYIQMYKRAHFWRVCTIVLNQLSLFLFSSGVILLLIYMTYIVQK